MSADDPPLELTSTGQLPREALDLLAALLIELERNRTDDKQKQDEQPVTRTAAG